MASQIREGLARAIVFVFEPSSVTPVSVRRQKSMGWRKRNAPRESSKDLAGMCQEGFSEPPANASRNSQ